MLKSLALGALVSTLCVQSALAGVIIEDEFDGETENNTIATAVQLGSGLFDIDPSPDVFGGPGFRTATVVGRVGEGADVDFYCFVLSVGGTVRLDIDTAVDLDDQDTMLWLFDGGGTLLAGSDDAASDPGSEATGLDSFIGDLYLDAGTYYVAVSDYYNPPNAAYYGYYYYYYEGEGPPPQGPLLYPPRGGGVGDSFVVDSFNLVNPDGGYGGTRFYVDEDSFGDSSFYSSGGQSGDAAGNEVYTLHVTVNPEPATVALFGLGLLGLVGVVRRRRRTDS